MQRRPVVCCFLGTARMLTRLADGGKEEGKSHEWPAGKFAGS